MAHPEVEEVDAEYIPADAPDLPLLSRSERTALKTLAKWTDTIFAIPGTNFRFGFDAIIGLFPGIGDTLMLLLQCYPLFVARKYHLSSHLQLRMTGRVFLDLFSGFIPLAGDLFDAHYKATYRNVRDLLQEVEERSRASKDSL